MYSGPKNCVCSGNYGCSDTEENEVDVIFNVLKVCINYSGSQLKFCTLENTLLPYYLQSGQKAELHFVAGG